MAPSSSLKAPLLPSRKADGIGSPKEQDVKPRQGTPVSSALNLTAAAVGSGILTLPFAFACCGAFWGAVLLLILAFLSNSTLVFLLQIGRHTGRSTFEQNAEFFFGPAGANTFKSLFTVLVIFIYVAYARVVLDLVPHFLEAQFGTRWFFGEVPVGLLCMSAMYFVIVFSRSLHALRFTSGLALGCLLYFVALLFLRAFRGMTQGAVPPAAADELDSERPRFLLAPPLLISSLLCHFNIFDIDMEIQPVYRSTVVPVCYVVIYGIAILYFFVGLTGFFLFGSGVSDDVLQEFAPDLPVQLARFLLGLTNAFRIPLIVGPLHRALWHQLGFQPPLPSARAQAGITFERRLRHAAEVAGIMLIGFFIAVRLPLGKVMGLIGCTCGTLTCVCFPAAMYLRFLASGSSALQGASRQKCKLRQAHAMIVLLAGLVVTVSGVYVNIFSA
mmetsp:Transcript_118404/g.230444  ORF Transcript_118404/g.230444 Transcript_118404/m.230444 type:complete len:443 (-) Transcript_118404:57-1385(-)